MRNKKYGKQLLSILLAGMLSLNVPVIALAESEEFLAAEEQVQEAADFTDPEANEAVGDGEFSDFIAGDEAASEGEDEQLAGFGDEEEITEAGDELDGFVNAKEEAVEADASNFPTEIPAGTTYKLTEDITLAEGQQIKILE